MQRVPTLLLVLILLPLTLQAQAKACPKKLKNILDCPVTGCGGSHIDQKLNRRKNIRSDNNPPIFRSLQWIKDRPNPKNFVKGGSRTELAVLGEGAHITVRAFLLKARPGNPEACNCGLSKPPENTDNHLVLVEEETLDLTAPATPAKTAEQNTLKVREEQSITAEFTPRVKRDHENFKIGNLIPRIKAAPRNALLVRITGLLMFDSEHFLSKPLIRVNDWEIHPVFKLEFCETGHNCKLKNNDGWKSLDDL